MKVFIHVNTSKQVDDKDHLKVFANEHAAKEWSKKPDQEGVVVECEVMASEMKPHVSQAYKDACDNLIYLKKEQFQVTNYTWLVLAALYILSRKFTAGTVGNDLLIGGAFVVGIVSLLVLWDFQSSIERFRNRLAHVYEDYFTKGECERLGLDAKSKHRYISAILSFAVVVATAFTAWAVRQS